MARFQAKTNAVLDADLEDLRCELGLKPSQKADLFRELTVLASWVVRQTLAGRRVMARGETDMHELDHPVIERLRRRMTPARLELDAAETHRLIEILDRGFNPPPALLDCLRRLASPERKVPELTWAEDSD